MEKELCDCGNVATWCYLPGYSNDSNSYSCDDCVPRGCACNHMSTLDHYDSNVPEGELNKDYKWINETTWVNLDDKGREYPCVEYDYDPDGFEIDND